MFIWTTINISPEISIFIRRSDPNSTKTQSVVDWPTPESTKEVTSFLGFVNFYRHFIPRFADIAAPLTCLTGNNATFRWDAEQQTACKQLQQAMISPPLPDYLKFNDHFVLTTDASEVRLGAVLSTRQGTTMEFTSRVLSPMETKYSTTEKECLAIVWAIRKFRHYLIGAKFTLD